MAAKPYERFDTEVGLEEARRRFVNRAHHLIFEQFVRSLAESDRRTITRAAVTKLGERYNPDRGFSRQVGDDFSRTVRAISGLYNVLDPQELSQTPAYSAREIQHQYLEGVHYSQLRERLETLIRRLLNESEVDLGIRWESGQSIRSGATLLDEKLVNDQLHWIRACGYETVRLPFEKGLGHFLHASARPELLSDVITDMYEAVEALAKIVTNRPDRDLSANRELFLSKVKASDEYKQLLKDYIDYANRFRHAGQEGRPRPDLSAKETESFIYLTGVFIRLAVPLP